LDARYSPIFKVEDQAAWEAKQEETPLAKGSKKKSKKKNWKETIWRTGVRIANSRLDGGTVSRVRFILFVGALLALTLAFMMNDDWFVREFATYDWARDLGF
jgi:hypothetical protein